MDISNICIKIVFCKYLSRNLVSTAAVATSYMEKFAPKSRFMDDVGSSGTVFYSGGTSASWKHQAKQHQIIANNKIMIGYSEY